MRLIDGDELEEKAWRFKLDSRELIAKMIEDAPTIDAVPIVRCKDCEYWDAKELYCCDFLTQDEMGFCKWGKRREEWV